MARVNLEKIRNLRKQKRLSQEEIATAAGFKSLYSYNRKELGHVPFTADELHNLAEFFEVPIEIFFDNSVAKTATRSNSA